ncbi:MAG: hypothetical protein U0414_30135 [Polyangiaceae bacterium]
MRITVKTRKVKLHLTDQDFATLGNMTARGYDNDYLHRDFVAEFFAEAMSETPPSIIT